MHPRPTAIVTTNNGNRLSPLIIDVEASIVNGAMEAHIADGAMYATDRE